MQECPPPGEKVHLKLIHCSPFFGQIFQIYLILDLFLPFFFFKFSALCAHFLWEEKFKSQNQGGGGNLEEIEPYLPAPTSG